MEELDVKVKEDLGLDDAVDVVTIYPEKKTFWEKVLQNLVHKVSAMLMKQGIKEVKSRIQKQHDKMSFPAVRMSLEEDIDLLCPLTSRR